ncbi:DUF6912 family protein [Brevibacterium linens]|uniref:Uncharacterized protein n=1 Tax=Brevibacterium linens TaxID=1703 RepID=A0A2H1JY46_BRELN|nr:hypothetical protein [Brevibacterium linens]AZU00398.1 hypothetical protein CXR29_06505 [Brevibacterium linens]SMX92467.1 hypothetical protein BLIN101_02799 [Brevibacterium linens]
MAIRCYIPTTLTALRSTLADVRAVAPDAQGRSLRGEEFETAEFDAMCIAAALAANAAFDPADTDAPGTESTAEATPARRVVVAYDAPESSPTEPLTDGFDLITVAEVDMARAASFHLDEDIVWDEAVQRGQESGAGAAEDHLGASDLLWYDASELEQLLGDAN